MERSILVTGGAGFWSRGFVRRALGLGAERVCVYSRDEHKHAAMRQEFGDDTRLRWMVGDVRDQDRLRRAMDSVDLVVHAAALKRVETGESDSVEMVKTNVIGAINVIEAAMRARVKKVIGLSSDKATESLNCYGATKFVSEKLFLAANNSRGAQGPIFAACRWGNVAGSTSSVIPLWRAAKERGEKAVIRDPEATRFHITLEQAIDLVVRLAETMRGGELLIPDLPAYRLADLAQAMGVECHPPSGLNPGEKLHESLDVGASSDKARRMTVDEIRGELAKMGLVA